MKIKMTTKKAIWIKKRTGNTFLLGFLLSGCSSGILFAQAKPAPAPPQSAPSPVTETPPKFLAGSFPLYDSPVFKAELAPVLIRINKVNAFVKTGDEYAKNGDWPNAQNAYQQALELSPHHLRALYGMIACSQALGDTAKEMDYYRTVVYHNGHAADGFYDTNTEKLMQFALLLNKTAQAAEAMSVYNHAAYALDYQDSQYNSGKPYLKTLLPELAAERVLPAQVRYTPERLQALADTTIAHEEMSFGSAKEALAHMREAVKLYPDSPVTNYYLGEALPSTATAEAKAAYQKAVQLGDAATIAAAKERLSTLP